MRFWLSSGAAFLAVCLIFQAQQVCARDASPEAAARAEALYQEGMGLLEGEQLDDAQARFLSAIEANDKHAPSWVGLGHVHLWRGDIDGAEKAFKKALSKRKKHAPAFNGLGLVYRERKNELRRAIRYFRDAMRADKTYAEAQYNLAQTFQRYGSSETLDAYKEVLQIDPNHPDARFQIGMIYEADGDYEEAEPFFRQQIDVKPDHYGAQLHLGIALKVLGRTDEAVQAVEKVVTTPNPYQRRAVLELAEVYQKRRDYDRSADLFDAYISALDAHEQAPYYDLSLVAAGRDLTRFRAAPPGEQRGLAQAFWGMRDPAPITEANERLLEHYRRVAYAREHFGAYRFPWDDRGEAYIRYGDPNHVSRSGDIRLERHPRILAVKEALIGQAGEAGVALVKKRADEVQASMISQRGDLMTEEERRRSRQVDQEQRGAQAGVVGGSILGWPVYPVPANSTWEYWIYVNPGVEVTFVQRHYNGPYEYAEAPLGMGRIARIWQDMNPRFVIQRVAHRKPATYRPDFATGPLDFYFYSAAFKGEAGKTALEVYYGIPTRHIAFVTEAGQGQMAYLERGVGVYDAAGQSVFRQRWEMPLRAAGAVDTSAGSFIPEMDRILLPPGQYRVSVQVLDRSSGKSQVYNQERFLGDFGDSSLSLSDIELASTIAASDKGKFLKGDIAVVPMASRAFGVEKPVSIYFEIYNLKRDEFGATKYKVSYEIRSLEQKSVGARVLGGLGKLLGRGDESGVVRIEYEQTGTTADERAYLELDMSSSEAGTQLLKVQVADENQSKIVGATTTFTIQE